MVEEKKYIIICGDRNWDDYEKIKKVLSSIDRTYTVIQGGCKGADTLAKNACIELGIQCITICAEWDKYGRSAGPIRNKAMLSLNPVQVIAFHSEIQNSKGTKNMITISMEKNIPCSCIS